MIVLMITLAVCYGFSVKEERLVIEEEVSKIMDKPLLMGGDFNGITRIEESTGISRENLIWQWLSEKEDQGKLVDCVRLGFKAPPPFTRVRRYSATQSYLDKWHASWALMVLTHISRAWLAPLKWQSGENVSDHDRVGITLGKWNIGKVEVDKGCKGWGKKQIKEFKLLMS